MKNWYNCLDGENIFLQKIVEKRISEILNTLLEENSEVDVEFDTILNQKLEDIIIDAMLEVNHRPEDIYSIFRGLQTIILDILKRPLFEIEDENIEQYISMMAMFVRDTSFLMMQNAYERLYQKKLNLPFDVERRLKIRRNNIKKTGRAGIDPQGLELF